MSSARLTTIKSTDEISSENLGELDLQSASGEIFRVVRVRKKSKFKGGWRRVFMRDFMDILTGLYRHAAKIEVIEWIIDHLDAQNRLIYNQSQVAKFSKIGRVTVNHTFKFLLEKRVLIKFGAVYVLNPEYISAFGSNEKNRNILIQYCDSEKTLFDDIE